MEKPRENILWGHPSGWSECCPAVLSLTISRAYSWFLREERCLLFEHFLSVWVVIENYL